MCWLRRSGWFPTGGSRIHSAKLKSRGERRGAETARGRLMDHRREIVAALLCLPLLGAATGSAHAQSFPTHPIRLISDAAPGSAIDVPMRIIADGLSRS